MVESSAAADQARLIVSNIETTEKYLTEHGISFKVYQPLFSLIYRRSATMQSSQSQKCWRR